MKFVPSVTPTLALMLVPAIAKDEVCFWIVKMPLRVANYPTLSVSPVAVNCCTAPDEVK